MFSRIGNLIYRSSESKNSASYVNRQSLNLTLDPSGTDFIEYSTDSSYFTDAHSLIPNSESQTTTTALKLQDSATPANNFFLSTLGDFTLCVKHKLNTSSTSTDIISHYFSDPQYDISFAEPYIRENSPFNVIVSKASNGPVEYEVSGNLIASNLTNGDISGTLSTVESVLPFTLNTGTGGNDFVFSLKNLDVSLNAYIYSQYYVTTSTNILGETVFAFSPTAEGTYNNQLDLSFGANSKMIFNVSDDTMTDISLVFGTTVDDSTSINDSVVTRTNDLVIVDISAGYDGERLVYFEDSSAGMGYAPASSGGGTTLSYTVDVSNNSIFRLDSGDGNGFEDKPPIAFNDNTTYIFDQSHASNANNTLVIGTVPDISSSIVSSGLTIMGTPGQPGAYTKYVADGSTVYYFSYQTENMGTASSPIAFYVVTVANNGTNNVYYIDGEEKPAIQLTQNGLYVFDQSDSTNALHPLRFQLNSDSTSYTTGVTVLGTQGTPNAYVMIEITDNTPILNYYCTNHSGMGNIFSKGITYTTTSQISNTEENMTDTYLNNYEIRVNVYDKENYSSNIFNTPSFDHWRPAYDYTKGNVYRDPSTQSSSNIYGTLITPTTINAPSGIYISAGNNHYSPMKEDMLYLSYTNNVTPLDNTKYSVWNHTGANEYSLYNTNNTTKRIYGDWIHINTNNNPFLLSKIYIPINKFHNSAYYTPTRMFLIGSNDGYNWYGLIEDRDVFGGTGIDPNDSVENIYDITDNGGNPNTTHKYEEELSWNETSYSHYRICFTGWYTSQPHWTGVDGIMIFGKSTSLVTTEYDGALTTFQVSVSGESFYIDNNKNPILDLQPGNVYRFSQHDESNTNYPIKFSTTLDGTHNSGTEYATGIYTTGTPGDFNAHTVIDFIENPYVKLYYYSDISSNMGNSAFTV